MSDKVSSRRAVGALLGSVGLAALLGLGLLTTGGYARAIGPPGDATCNGVTNSIDASVILQYDAGLMDAPNKLWLGGADVNCDSSVNAVDASLILQDDAGLYQIRP